jgi:drug/metabolite transporter (DMT)-like permease
MGSIPLWIELTQASTLMIALSRLSLGAGLSYLVFRRRLELMSALRENPRLVLALGVCFAVHWYTYFEAIRRTSATLGLLSLSTFGIHVSWMSFLFGTRRAGPLEWVGIALSAVGVFVLAPSVEASPELSVGFAFGMVSALLYATLPHLHQRLAHVSHATRTVLQLGVAWLCFLPAAPFLSYDLPARDWAILAVLGVLCTFVAHNLWISITTEVAPATSGLLYYLAIPVTIALEWAVLGRPPRPAEVLGAALIASGSLLGPVVRRARMLSLPPPPAD